MDIKTLIANCIERPTRQLVRCKYCKNAFKDGILEHDPNCTVVHLKNFLRLQSQKDVHISQLGQDLQTSLLRIAELEAALKIATEPPPQVEVVASTEPPPEGFFGRLRSWLR